MAKILWTLSLLGLVACSSAPVSKTNHLTAATTWFETAGENFALQYQAYTLARYALDNNLKSLKKGAVPAVVVDVDETVLSNGPAQAKIVLSGKPYPYGWEEWVKEASAQAIRGATEFLTYAASKKVRVFYVTNRKEEHRAATIKNLQAAGFPDVSEATVLCSRGDWDKEARRKFIREKHEIVLLIGDNLNDFSSEFSGKSVVGRNATVDAQREKFGTTYIVIPNPMYGDWESALFGGDYSLPEMDRLNSFKVTLEKMTSPQTLRR